jgi:hypothetical protein
MTDTPNPGAFAERMQPRIVVNGTDANRTAATDTHDVEMEVEEALGRLEALSDLPVTDHVSVYEGVQQRLSEILSNVDDV